MAFLHEDSDEIEDAVRGDTEASDESTIDRSTNLVTFHAKSPVRLVNGAIESFHESHHHAE